MICWLRRLRPVTLTSGLRCERGLWLDAAIRGVGSRAGDDAAAYGTVLRQLPELIEHLEQREDLWGDEWASLKEAVATLNSGGIRAERLGATGLLVHSIEVPEAPGPLLAKSFLPGTKRYLLAFDRGGGLYDYRYERPRYAWADTVIRPILTPPDAARIAARPRALLDE